MKTILLFGLAILLAGCTAQPPVQEPLPPPAPGQYFAFDFNTNQNAAPIPGYGAAYVINVSEETIIIPLLTWENSTMLSEFYYNELGLRPVFTEMMLPRVHRDNVLVLEPGERFLAFSVAFYQEHRERYPGAIYDTRIIINNRAVNVRGYIGL